MDANRFDALVRSLDTSVPRRAALGGALVTGLAALLPRFGLADAEARKKRRKKCKGNKKKCGKKCIPKSQCCHGCPPNALCVTGVCVFCASGEGVCGDACVDLTADSANCGFCDRICPSGGCLNGACTCPSGIDCPNGCTCLATEDGPLACAAAPPVEVSCASSADCELGAVCLDQAQPFCAAVCQG